eukprot:jgi/Bigna1/73824/fgenesh1_pg.26_\
MQALQALDRVTDREAVQDRKAILRAIELVGSCSIKIRRGGVRNNGKAGADMALWRKWSERVVNMLKHDDIEMRHSALVFLEANLPLMSKAEFKARANKLSDRLMAIAYKCLSNGTETIKKQLAVGLAAAHCLTLMFKLSTTANIPIRDIIAKCVPRLVPKLTAAGGTRSVRFRLAILLNLARCLRSSFKPFVNQTKGLCLGVLFHGNERLEGMAIEVLMEIFTCVNPKNGISSLIASVLKELSAQLQLPIYRDNDEHKGASSNGGGHSHRIESLGLNPIQSASGSVVWLEAFERRVAKLLRILFVCIISREAEMDLAELTRNLLALLASDDIGVDKYEPSIPVKTQTLLIIRETISSTRQHIAPYIPSLVEVQIDILIKMFRGKGGAGARKVLSTLLLSSKEAGSNNVLQASIYDCLGELMNLGPGIISKHTGPIIDLAQRELRELLGYLQSQAASSSNVVTNETGGGGGGGLYREEKENFGEKKKMWGCETVQRSFKRICQLTSLGAGFRIKIGGNTSREHRATDIEVAQQTAARGSESKPTFLRGQPAIGMICGDYIQAPMGAIDTIAARVFVGLTPAVAFGHSQTPLVDASSARSPWSSYMHPEIQSRLRQATLRLLIDSMLCPLPLKERIPSPMFLFVLNLCQKARNDPDAQVRATAIRGISACHYIMPTNEGTAVLASTLAKLQNAISGVSSRHMEEQTDRKKTESPPPSNVGGDGEPESSVPPSAEGASSEAAAEKETSHSERTTKDDAVGGREISEGLTAEYASISKELAGIARITSRNSQLLDHLLQKRMLTTATEEKTVEAATESESAQRLGSEQQQLKEQVKIDGVKQGDRKAETPSAQLPATSGESLNSKIKTGMELEPTSPAEERIDESQFQIDKEELDKGDADDDGDDSLCDIDETSGPDDGDTGKLWAQD